QQQAQKKEPDVLLPPLSSRQEQAEAAILQKLKDTHVLLNETRKAHLDLRADLAGLKERERELIEQQKSLKGKVDTSELEEELGELQIRRKECESNGQLREKEIASCQERIKELQTEFFEVEQGVRLQSLASYVKPEDRNYEASQPSVRETMTQEQ